MNNLFNIKDYVVVITGGTGVLGRSIAKYLALEGAKVIIACLLDVFLIHNIHLDKFASTSSSCDIIYNLLSNVFFTSSDDYFRTFEGEIFCDTAA